MYFSLILQTISTCIFFVKLDNLHIVVMDLSSPPNQYTYNDKQTMKKRCNHNQQENNILCNINTGFIEKYRILVNKI